MNLSGQAIFHNLYDHLLRQISLSKAFGTTLTCYGCCNHFTNYVNPKI